MKISYGSVASPLIRNPRDIPRAEKYDSDSDDDFSYEELVQKASAFTLPFDEDRGFRGTELRFLSFERPHMRAFHGSWICNFVSTFVQFAVAPLLPEIKISLNLAKSEIWTSNIWSSIGGVPLLFMLGSFSDKYGGRFMATLLLTLMAVPCALTGLVKSLDGLLLVRLIIGSLDNSVPCQYWISCHFVREISGTAMAVSSGLGATGSGLVQLFVGSILFSFCLFLTGNNADLAWRLALIFPALMAFITAFFFFLYSEDCPLGNHSVVKKAGLMMERSAMDSFRSGALNLNSWILFLQ
jgi:MFS transporter, NNP family, nitrate/nitrite transporter